MHNNKLKGNLYLLLTAILWGGGFIFQRWGGEHLSAFSFNAFRMIITSLTFLILYLITYKKNIEKETKELNKKTLIYALITGTVLFIGYYCQQIGLEHITAAKSGFLTSTQVVIIPILAIFLNKKAKIQVWISALLALIGFYIMSMNEKFVPSLWDLITILGALFFSIQVLMFDHVKESINFYKYGMILALTTSVLSFIFACIFDTTSSTNILSATIPALYLGIFSGALAYIFEVKGHKYNTNPTVAVLIMSLESVFALIFGFIFLKEVISLKEGIGCIIVGLSVILSQLDFKEIKLFKNKMTD